MNKTSDLVGLVMDYESGAMNAEQVIKFFSKLIKTGLAWQLQGAYGRMAANLIESGFIDKKGKILKYPEEG